MCCEKVSIDGNVANKDSGISQEYAAYENWLTPHILWSREHSFRELADKSNTHTFNKWRRVANLTNPVLPHRRSRVLFELRAVSCSGMFSFPTLCLWTST